MNTRLLAVALMAMSVSALMQTQQQPVRKPTTK
jgi:type II secretory pathway component PulK